jgi:hypothetical protein
LFPKLNNPSVSVFHIRKQRINKQAGLFRFIINGGETALSKIFAVARSTHTSASQTTILPFRRKIQKYNLTSD